METENDTQTKAEIKQAKKLKKKFRKFVKEFGHAPENVGQFCAEYGIDEWDFLESYGSITHLEQDLWADYFKKTFAMVVAQEVFPEYSSREKLLSFYYTLFEVLKKHDYYTRWRLNTCSFLDFDPAEYHTFNKHFEDFVEVIVAEGIEAEEIEPRMILGDKYAGWHTYQLNYLLGYWAEDDSEDYQNTDEAVEKSVNLGFDLMGRNIMDSAFDFVKFWWQK